MSFLTKIILVRKVVDPHHINADPDPGPAAFHLNADPDLNPSRLYFGPSGLNVSVHGSRRLCFDPLKLINFYFYGDLQIKMCI